MKKLILLIIITFICCSHIAFAQTYREQFDKLNDLSVSEGKTSNLRSVLGGRGSRFMQIGILMYKATKDIRYLNQFIILSKRIMDRRSDNWNNIYNEMIDLPMSSYGAECIVLKSPNQVNNYAGWTRFNDNSDNSTCFMWASFMESGMITYPMADFILLMQEHPELNNTALPFEAMSNSAGITNSYNGASVLTFSDYAIWLKQKIKETLNYELNSNNYYYGDSYFHNSENAGGNGYTAINQQSAIARTCVLMYIISVNDGAPITDYRDAAERTATKVYEAWNDPAIGSSIFALSNGAPWHAWCHMPACQHGYWEDISHAWLEAELIKLMVDNNTLLHNSNGYDFNTGYLEKIANGFLYVMCAKPASVAMNVYGTDLNCDQACQDGVNPIAPPPRHFFQSGHYVFLSEYNPGVYQAISDMYSPDQVIAGTQNLIFKDLDGNRGDVLYGLAQLCYYENLFNPIAVKYGPDDRGYSYTGCASGDFDANGVEDFASIRTKTPPSTNEVLESYEVNSNNSISLVSDADLAGNFKYLAAGNINTSDPNDELVSIDIQNNLIVVFKKQSGTFVQVTQIAAPPFGAAGGSFMGIGVGEFSSAYPGKEIIINSSGGFGSETFKMYGYDATANLLVNIPINNSIVGVISKFTIGDFNGDGIDEIALFDNLSQKISTYSLIAGNLLQLNASSSPINLTSSLDGITSGDFDGDGTDDIIFYKKLNSINSVFQIYRQNGTALILKGEEIFNPNQKNGIMCKLRLKNNPLSEGLVTLRNYDGQISIFNMDGLCPGLNLNNQDINSTTTLGNNYPVDYHVHGALVVGNNFNVAASSIVDMSSGKEINFKPGFTSVAGSDLYAYIAPGLECNPSTFRRNIPHTPEGNTPAYTSRFEKPKTITNIGISPNPNNGSFQISITRNEQPIAIKEIRVYDIMGKVIWSTGASSNSTFNVDISNYSPGIYYVRAVNESGDIEMKKFIKQ
jgi:hypothetical protein